MKDTKCELGDLFCFPFIIIVLFYIITFLHKLKTSLLLVCIIIIWLFILREWWLFKNGDTKTTWRYSIRKHWEAEITQKEKFFNVRIQIWQSLECSSLNFTLFYTPFYLTNMIIFIIISVHICLFSWKKKFFPFSSQKQNANIFFSFGLIIIRIVLGFIILI